MNKCLFKICLFVSVSLIFSTLELLAGNDKPVTGARAVGMGSTSLTLTDHWSTFNNIGALAGVSKLSGGLYYENRFNTALFQSYCASLAAPIKKFGTAGLNVRSFGNSLYSENSLGLGFSQKFGIASLGVQADYLMISGKEMGTRSAVAINFGGMAELTPQLMFGGFIYNLNQAKMADYKDERIPTVMRAGLSYRPGKKIILNGEVEKDIDLKPITRFGIEYQVIEKVFFRTGFSTVPTIVNGGMGIRHKRFDFDYAISSHSKLGLSHHLSINFLLQKPKEEKEKN